MEATFNPGDVCDGCESTGYGSDCRYLQKYKMNEAETKLVEALRSGEYIQAFGQLIESNGNTNFYCCLGVACNLFNPEEWKGFFYLGELFHLPPEVANWLNWHDYGELNFTDRHDNEITLAGLNDSGFSFSQIADLIEAGLVQHIGE